MGNLLTRVELSLKEIEVVEKYARETAKNHKSYGRSIKQIESNIIQGKIGEVGFYKMFSKYLKSSTDFTHNMSCDIGWDFELIYGTDIHKIDVKCVKQSSKRFYFNPYNIEKIDYYFIVKRTGDNIVEYVGKISTKDILEKCDIYINKKDNRKSYSMELDNLT